MAPRCHSDQKQPPVDMPEAANPNAPLDSSGLLLRYEGASKNQSCNYAFDWEHLAQEFGVECELAVHGKADSSQGKFRPVASRAKQRSAIDHSGKKVVD